MSTNEPQSRLKRSLRFSRALWGALFLIVICLTLLYYLLGHHSEIDKIAYDKLVNGENLENKVIETQVSKQHRTGLQKNVFFNNDGQRLEFRLKSSHSEIALEKMDRHIEIVEHLQDVTCWLQESVYFVLPDSRQAFLKEDGRLLISGENPQEAASWVSKNDPYLVKEQRVLLLKAENATYHHKGEKFVANRVRVLRYVAPNHDLDEVFLNSPLIADGVASHVEFSLAGKGLDFKADHFKARFSTKHEIK